MGTYVTTDGFNRPTLQEIKLRMQERFRAVFGDTIDTDESGPTGQLVGLLSKALADAWDSAQEVYASHDPNMASGLALDVVCGLTGIMRIQAAPSQCLVACYAAQDNLGLVLGSGKQVKRARGGLVFSLRDPLTIQTSACRDLYLVLPTEPTPGTTVTIVTTFGTFSVMVPATANPTLSTYQLLASAIAASSWEGDSVAWDDGGAPAGAQFTDSCLRLVSPEEDFGFADATPWSAALCGSVGWFDCDEDGANSALAGEISQVATPETGWELCYNLTTAILGRLVETNEELRIRRAQSFRAGYATETAIQQALLNRVSGIVSALVVSNRTMGTDGDGRPPKSFEAIVQGGLDQVIGQVIWDTMPAGIESYADTTPGGGGVAVNVTDSQGATQVVKFSRPVSKYLHLKLFYKLYSEEAFPADGETRLRDAILAWSLSEFTLGQDVIPQRFYTPIYTVPGIGPVIVQVALTDGEDAAPSSWSTDPIVVGGRVIVSLLSKNLSIQETV